MLGYWLSKLCSWTSPLSNGPEIGDVVDGLLVMQRYWDSGGSTGDPTHVYIDTGTSAELREISNLISHGKGVWASTGRYQFEERGANYLGTSGSLDLFIVWGDKVEIVAVGKLGVTHREELSEIDSDVAPALRIAVNIARDNGLISSETTIHAVA